MDRSLGQTTIQKVHHRIRRLERDKEDQLKQTSQLQKEYASLRAQVVREKQALLAARDDENELLLRFIQAKLLHELLADDAAELDDDLDQLSRDVAALQGDLQVKQRVQSRLSAAEQQRRNELGDIQFSTARLAKRTLDVEGTLRHASRHLDATRRMFHEESFVLSTMQDRLHAVRDTVNAALSSSVQSERHRTASASR